MAQSIAGWLESAEGLHILLVGKTGNGKSSAGNSIIGRGDVFSTSSGSESETKDCSWETSQIGERYLTVYDSPGLCDTDDVVDSPKQMMEAFQNAINYNPAGFHAIIFVLKFGNRMTEEEYGAVQELEKMLGDNIIRDFGVVLFTNGDTFYRMVKKNSNYRTFEEWCRQQEHSMKRILQNCQYRCVLFDNVTEEDKERFKHQRSELLKCLNELASCAGRYNSTNFEKAKQGWRDALAAKEAKALYQSVQQKIGEICSEIGQTWLQNKEFNSHFHDSIKAKIEETEKLASQLTGAPQALMRSQLENLKRALGKSKDGELKDGDGELLKATQCVVHNVTEGTLRIMKAVFGNLLFAVPTILTAAGAVLMAIMKTRYNTLK